MPACDLEDLRFLELNKTTTDELLKKGVGVQPHCRECVMMARKYKLKIPACPCAIDCNGIFRVKNKYPWSSI